ncbi:MAG: L,D-transpeptidase family protein [Sphingomonas sp.]|nr:L,D-transpeptidase family protein [Sphingomonas sp.]MBW0007084.1 L,D-transpeptidase family protein [Sphingomonas sp.]
MAASRKANRRVRRARLACALSFFLLGGTAAAAWSVARQPTPIKASAPKTVPAPLNRIPVSDEALRQAYAAGSIDRPVKSILNVPGRMQYGDFRWDERGVPAGPTWIRVDLKSQMLSVFRGGEEIGTAVILYGADSVPTPTGKFPILAKLKDHRSATYDAPMPYTLRLTGDGVSIHASNVRWGYATHGCIGVPEAFAAKLFNAASVNDEVLIVG